MNVPIVPGSIDGDASIMKILGFHLNGGLHLGVVEGDQVIDLQAVDSAIPSDLGEVLRRHDGDLSSLKTAASRAPATARRPLAGLKYGLPVARPGKVICLGLNYLEHVKEGSQRDNIPKFPTIFMRANSSLVPHGEPIIRPQASETLDYEAELIFVVGKRAKHLTVANAYSCIAGYACGNEGSVREFQRKTTQWDMGKNFDRTGGFGPWMVTADELPPGGKALKIETRLNGEVMQSDNTDNMMFPIAETIAYVTQGMTLEPGDIVFTGTPSGVGHARKPNPVWMKPGDTCEIHIERVGVLVNPIAAEK
jgi:acylpyruvate hydrolase